MVEGMSVNRRGRSRSGQRRPRGQQQPVAAAASYSQAMSRGNRPRSRSRNRGVDMSTQGLIRFSNRQIVAKVIVKKADKTLGSGVTQLDPIGMGGFAAKLGPLFGQSRWISAKLTYESTVSTATNGVVAYGLDWGCSKDAINDIEKITALNPSISHSPWDSQSKFPSIPRARLNARQWYDNDATNPEDKCFASLLWMVRGVPEVTADEGTFGFIWMDYTIELRGPKV